MTLSPHPAAPVAEGQPPEMASPSRARTSAQLDPEPLASASPLPPGESLGGRFVVEAVVRRGGMGIIQRGRDLQTGSPVAIKIVGTPSGSSQARFAREVKILSELSHPGIVRHLGHGETSRGVHWLVMEWLDGHDLGERLAAEQKLRVADGLAFARRVAEALDVAHRRGIVHRDIKPANLFLRGGDPRDVRVIDFGIARFDGPAPTLTQDGSLVGTVGYMAPEQALCEADIDARADVFAIGCVLYQCLTGQAPFASAHPVGVLAKVLREDPPKASELNPELDGRVDALFASLLAKRREQRLASAAAICEELDAIEKGTASPRPAARRFASAGPTGEQRVVSVILGRRRGIQRAEERHPPDDEALSAELASRFGAEVASLKGGAMLLVLTGLAEANDRAAQAARCALFVRSRRPDLVLSVATGLVTTGGAVPVGAAIDRAAELLADGAAPAGVLLDDATVGLIGPRFQVEREGGSNVLVAAGREFAAPRFLMGRPTPHVGRARELDMLNGLLDECVTSSVARAVLVTGPPGIGKTRFASEWLGSAGHAGGVRVLFAHSEPGFAGSTLSLVQQLVRDAAGLREADPATVQLERLREYLARLLGSPDDTDGLAFLAEVVGLGALLEPSMGVRAARANPDMMRYLTQRALHDWIAAEVEREPVIIVLEDVHWADAPSVAFLAEVLRRNVERPLLVVALARPEAEKQFPELAEQAALCIRLPRLPARAAQQLVTAVIEASPDDPVVARIIRTADGNPFYLEELIRRVASGSTDWPDTVLAMAQSRIEQLEPAARRVLRAAAVFGERCWDLGVADVAGADVDAGALLGTLEQSELLLRVPASRFPKAQEYRFRHALFRDAAYAMMTAEDRQSSHGAAGEWLERHAEKDAAILADHYEAAAMGERACPWLVRAARAALDVGDIESTVRFAARGVKLGAAGADKGALLLSRSYAEALGCRPNLDVSREALELLPVGSGRWWLGVGVFLVGACMRGRPGEAASHLRLAEQAPFPEERDHAMAQGIMILVAGCVLIGKADLVHGVLARAERAFSSSGSDAVFDAFMDTARSSLASIAAVDGQWELERGYHGLARCAEAMRRLGAPDGECTALNYFSVAATHLGRYEEARDAGRRSLGLSQRTSFRHTEGWARLFLAKAHLRLGELDAALEVVRALADTIDWTVQQMLPVIIGEARLRAGDLSGAEAAVSAAFSGQSPRLQRLAACVLGRAQLGLGDATAALSTVERALATETSGGLESDIDLLCLRAEARHGRGDLEGARAAIQKAHRFVSRIAAGVADASLRASFLTAVEPCARTLRLHTEWMPRAW